MDLLLFLSSGLSRQAQSVLTPNNARYIQCNGLRLSIFMRNPTQPYAIKRSALRRVLDDWYP